MGSVINHNNHCTSTTINKAKGQPRLTTAQRDSATCQEALVAARRRRGRKRQASAEWAEKWRTWTHEGGPQAAYCPAIWWLPGAPR